MRTWKFEGWRWRVTKPQPSVTRARPRRARRSRRENVDEPSSLSYGPRPAGAGGPAALAHGGGSFRRTACARGHSAASPAHRGSARRQQRRLLPHGLGLERPWAPVDRGDRVCRRRARGRSLGAPLGCAILWAAPDRRVMLHHPIVSWGRDRGFLHEFEHTATADPTIVTSRIQASLTPHPSAARR